MEKAPVPTLESALFAAWCKMDAVQKDKKNPAFRSSYADINAVLDVVVPALKESGVRLSQSPVVGEAPKHAYLKTTFSYAESGQNESFISDAPLAKDDPQGVGSAITYLRRYALISYFGLQTEDDDANHASGVGPAALPRPAAPPVGPVTAAAAAASPVGPPPGIPRPPARPPIGPKIGGSR